MIGKVCGYRPKEFIHTIGDAHIYLNHLDQVETYMNRTPKKLPTLKILGEHSTIDSIKPEHIILTDYNPEPAIKAPIAV